MGKRKERRLAAKTAVNRRVKLDLLAEPSGDFGDSSNKEEVGGGDNSNHAGSPNSPSSSGQKPENPLLLLGQYSDEEEMEEDSGREISNDNGENSPNEQVKVDSHGVTKADNDEINQTVEKDDQDNKEHSISSPLNVLPQTEENTVVEEITVLPLQKETDAVEQTSVPLTSDTQTGDVDSGWKMVLHEESNSYYYWNVLTGQTSWEVPVDLIQGNESAYQATATLGPEIEASIATQVTNGPVIEVHNENHTEIISNDVVEGNFVNTMSGEDGVSYNVGLSNGMAHYTDPCIQEMGNDVNQGTVGDVSCDSYRLLRLGESLLERLKCLKVENEKISKLMIEVELRLADIKSLVPYGSSLLPFWLHSENQLRKIEASIEKEIVEHSSKGANINEGEKKVEEKVSEGNENEKEKEIGGEDIIDEDMDVEMEVEDVQNGPHSEEEEGEIPAPPNEEWVPPPPPDEEPLPPPPPDEPVQSAQAYSYGEQQQQYNYSYPIPGGSTVDYYGQQVANPEYSYVDANGLQVAAPLYYAPYPPATSVVDPTAYYTLPEPAVPGVTSTCTPTESVTKVAQPKVAKSKKRAAAAVPGLRSNKKVSGLVDKWKAVKEELHEDQEPEDALEALEKKKQREIEQWRAQQIATGEAKDNANFQPLGGDWRERVKKKRAKKSIEDKNQKPDLVLLTKQLPSGWQAYWDEASKQVYYGNSKTSETSWTKPKN